MAGSIQHRRFKLQIDEGNEKKGMEGLEEYA